MKELQSSGGAARYAGQIGRAQFHYTVADRPLMQRVFDEDLWPVHTPAGPQTVICVFVVVPTVVGAVGFGSQGEVAAARRRCGRGSCGRRARARPAAKEPRRVLRGQRVSRA